MKCVVGRRYRVPCMLVKVDPGFRCYMPVLHSHVGEVSGRQHSHIDLRFITDFQIRKLGIKLNEITAATTVGKVIYRRKKCVRLHPVIQNYHPEQENAVRIVEPQVAEKRLNLETLICPHQGCSLDNVEPTEFRGQNCLVCPCHGFAWSTKDGSLVPHDL